MPLRTGMLQPPGPQQTSVRSGSSDEVQQTPYPFFMAIMAAIEAREPSAVGRARMIALHAVATARALLLTDEVVDTIRIGALLANIGTLNIPETILHKTDSLTETEIEMIRKHPVLGVDMLAVVPQLRKILPLVLHHHEGFDGSGYPHGIKGEAIPLGARIIRVVETYDALTSPRPYRAAFSPAEALELLANGSGREFDPRVVNAFTARMRRNLAIHDEILDRWDDMQQQARVWRLVANLND